MTDSVQDRRLAVIARVYSEWAAEQGDVRPDPKYAVAGPSQYPEGAVALSAGTEADRDFDKRVREALEAEGLPVVWRP